MKKEQEADEAKIELKMLPSHLKYVFLEDGGNKPVKISSSLSIQEEHKSITIMKDNNKVMGWVLSDLKGINPSYCMHKIMLEENFKSLAQLQ